MRRPRYALIDHREPLHVLETFPCLQQVTSLSIRLRRFQHPDVRQRQVPRRLEQEREISGLALGQIQHVSELPKQTPDRDLEIWIVVDG